MSLVLTEQLVASIAPGEASLREGRGLVSRGAFRALGRSDDGALFFADCAGSGKEPYKVALDLATDGESPAALCTCPSRAQPCKHAVGLMLAVVLKGDEFPVATPTEQALKVRAEGSRGASEAKGRGTSRVALAKKVDEQRAALEGLEGFLIDLVSAGLGSLDAAAVSTIESQAARLGDVDLQGARGALRRLGSWVAAQEGADAHRATRVSAALAQLWVLARRGPGALEPRASSGPREPVDERVEALLGRRWRFDQLREAGHGAQGLTLFELAHERYDDPVSEHAITSGWLLELTSGEVYVERTIIPFKALQSADVKHRASREGVLEVREAALHPGATLNRRVRWSERDPEAVRERPRTEEDYGLVHGRACGVESALARWRAELREPLGEREAVLLVRARRFGRVRGELTLEDHEGARLALRDHPRATCSGATLLARAAATYPEGSVAVRVWCEQGSGRPLAQPLALVSGNVHLRLGR